MSMTESIERMKTMMVLDKDFQTVMLTCTAGRVDDALFDEIERLRSGYAAVLHEAADDDPLVQPAYVRQRIADLTDWKARAFESARRHDAAAAAFAEAAQLYEAAGKPAAARQAQDLAGEARMACAGDFDAEIARLRERLEGASHGSLERIGLLVALGELLGRANDDFQAVEVLEEAERELAGLGGGPDDAELLKNLLESVTRIQQGEEIAGSSPIETGISRRALEQRLLLALANAYRTTNPAKAGEYEDRLRALDDGKDASIRDLMGKFLDAGQDVTRFLKSR